ncbi:thioredoxin family protein [Candidatus Woesearchaeota archaeon]|nr:thioredoxin family protein [Candidatus Woesearchaeota archaeon]
MKQSNKTESALYAALALAAAISLLNVFILQIRAEQVSEAKEAAEELARPADIEATKILLSGCEECFDIQNALEELKKQNVNLLTEKSLFIEDEEAKELIRRYGIEKIPALVISGEVNKTSQLAAYFEKTGVISGDGTAVYTNIKPPYYNTTAKKVVGKVSVLNIVDSQCETCASLSQVKESLKQAGVVITEEKTYEYSSPEGQELIDRFNVSRAPALLISAEVNHYAGVGSQLQQLAEEKSGFYALHSTSPPYRDLQQDRIVGEVTLILLKDGSCAECYDVKINKQILQGFGVAITEEETYDVSSEEGQALIAKYGIEKAPVILMSPDAAHYPALAQAWKSVGTVESDGWHVMRKPETLGTYKELESGKAVQAG